LPTAIWLRTEVSADGAHPESATASTIATATELTIRSGTDGHIDEGRVRSMSRLWQTWPPIA
jgi:hypothetical protein